MTENSRSCPTCGEPLEADDDCLACAFSGALASDTSPGTEGAASNFGDFAPLEPGEFGRYMLKHKRGEGGMGIVWEAEDSALQRAVALKMIRGFAFSTETEKQRFAAEATAVAQLDHPHIVPIYDVGEFDEQPFFTMKLLEGGTLSTRLAVGPLDESESARIMEKIARAIHHAHERGVLHRDLKPDNVLFDNEGEPYLSDFGLAKLLDAEVSLTRTIAQVGTPHYMSPEQARGKPSEITAASDVWGAGALFYHMLTGHLPFPGATSGEIFDRVANQDPLPMARSGDKIDPELETLCLRCMENDPKERLTSAEALADELKRWLAGESIHTKSVRPQVLLRRWLRRHPWRIGIALTLACVVTAGAFLIPTLLPREKIEATDGPSTTSKAAYIPRKFVMETFSIDGDREGSRFFVGWVGQHHGIIPGDWDNDPSRGSYIFHIEREDLDGGIALRVLNYHLPEEGRKYYLPNLTSEPVVYRVTDPMWNEGATSDDPDLEFVSLQHKDRYLRHSSRMLFNHPPYSGSKEKSKRIFQQDSTWTVHQVR